MIPRRTSIRSRVLHVVMTTTLVALLVSAAALLAYEMAAHRAGWERDLRTQAELVALASAPALAFDDPTVAGENLLLLRHRPHIEAAVIYDATGELFAHFSRPDQPPPPPVIDPRQRDAAFDGDRLRLVQPIAQQGQEIGAMVVRAHYDVLPRLLGTLAILGGVMLVALGFAALVARRLQSTVTGPILAVSDVAREVVQHRNFALRAPRTSDDEVGALVDAFNDMLRELGEQAVALQATDRRKDEFLATLAHELRNPLAPISTALSILGREEEVDAATRARLVAMMKRQMQQFVRLIDDLMEVSRVSTGHLALRIERVDLVQILRSAVESVAASLLERGHTLVVEWPPAVWIDGDATRLLQVFANLLGNASKYTDRGGRVEIVFAIDADTVEVRITDNGIGIAPDMHSAVFEMFVQADRSLSGGRSGLGVGLSLARQLVTLHGGTLTLDSEGLGRGSTFRVRLRRANEPAAGSTAAATAGAAATAAAASAGSRTRSVAVPATPANAVGRFDAAVADDAAVDTIDIAEPAGPGGPTRPDPAVRAGDAASPADPQPLHVLLADDNRDYADSMAALLRSSGHRVDVAYDGLSALEAARRSLPDVGLFDVGMPGLDGYELAAAVRREPGGARCLLLAVTGWGQQADRLRARDAGYDEHLVKPVDMDTLQRLLSTRGA